MYIHSYLYKSNKSAYINKLVTKLITQTIEVKNKIILLFNIIL